MIDLLKRAKMVAFGAHGAAGQQRKFSGGPYVLHCERVASILAQSDCNTYTQALGWMHDVMEDTEITDVYLRLYFHEEFVSDLRALTDEKQFKKDLMDVLLDVRSRDRATRKADFNNRLREASKAVHNVKVADILDNVSDIVEEAVSNADTERWVRLYLNEKAVQLIHLHNAKPELRAAAEAMIREEMAKL